MDAERLLVFTLGAEQYAVPLSSVREVTCLTDVTPVPYTPPHFKGIMNLRGQVISIIDLRLKLGFARGEPSPETAIIILELPPLSLGVVVDSVDCVMAARPDEIEPAPAVESPMPTDYLLGVTRKDQRLVIVLDIGKTLGVEDIKHCNESVRTGASQRKAS